MVEPKLDMTNPFGMLVTGIDGKSVEMRCNACQLRHFATLETFMNERCASAKCDAARGKA